MINLVGVCYVKPKCIRMRISDEWHVESILFSNDLLVSGYEEKLLLEYIHYFFC